ncbi:MAG: hypothetical protein FJ304_27010, partial [Planctomycetes bacterium]|nr:hypothetical protein [Planctomycetota bacterium]
PEARGPAPTARRPGAPPDEGNGLRVLTYLRLHWLMILFCGSLLGTAGALAAWNLLASKYESYALLQVSSAPTALANQNNPNQPRTEFATYVKTTAALLKSEFVLNAALRDIKDLPTIKAQSDPIKYLDEELQVSWQDGSEVVRITFKGAEPSDAKKIVDAVQNAFMKEVIQKDVAEKQVFLKKVEDAQIDIKKLLKQQTEKDKPAPGGVVPAGGPPAVPGAPGVVPPPVPGLLPIDIINRIDPRILINKLVGLQQDVERLPLVIRDAQRREGLLKEKLKLLKEAPIPQATQNMIDNDQDVVVEKLRMIKAKSEYNKALYAGDPKNPTPAVLELKDAFEAQEARWTKVRKEKLETLDGLRRLDEAKKIAAELEEVIRGVQRSQEQLDHAKAQLAKAEKQLVELPLPTEKPGGGLIPVRFEDKILYAPENSALDTTDGIYRNLVRQYLLIQMELNSPPRVRVIQTASHPTQKDMKKQYLGTGAAGVLGFVLVALGVVAFETVARRVSSLADVKSAVPVPVVAVIPGAPTRDLAGRAATGEAIDKLRAYVSQTWLSRGATTIAVTSPIGDEGKAFAAFGLASSLAQAGYKTLLVDFDLREPVLHAYAGVPNLAGACELLRGETDARNAVQFLPSGLHLLPAGKWSDEARKAATGERLEGVLNKLKEPYDCVVLHGHALLTVAESVEAARRCEVVLVCARYRETATPLLKRATERVATMEVPFCGVVYVGATEQEALC